MRCTVALCAAGLAVTVWMAAPPAGAQGSGVTGLHRPFDELLDLNVRDGDVYYRALKQARGTLDRYVTSLDVTQAEYERWSRDERLAFWLNAYNALVLQSVIDRYPIRGKAPEYPSDSVRQIPGAFEKQTHRVAGRVLTLDQIEKEILPEFADPRAYLALGRGARGSGRLRSEAFVGDRLESQVATATAEFLSNPRHVAIDRVSNELRLSAIIGWHDAEFAAAYGNGSDPRFAARSDIERAAVALVMPHLYPLEREFIERNTFVVRYTEFDWSLNDLTGGR